MIRASRPAITASIILLLILTSGCFLFPARVVSYRYEGKTYLSRTEFESVFQKAMENLLINCQPAYNTIDEDFIFIMPTRQWITGKIFVYTGVGPKSDLKDISSNLGYKTLETYFELLNKSGVFRSCKMVEAVDGNGLDEDLSSKSYKIIFQVEGEVFRLSIFAPGGERLTQVGAGDIELSSKYSWDRLVSIIGESISQ